jgi:hypothetical protein
MLIYCVDRPQQDRRLVLKATAAPIPQFKSRPDQADCCVTGSQLA